MVLQINERPIEWGFRAIAEQDFAPINISAACERLDMYSGVEEVREFDLAMRLSLIQQGATMHKLLAHKKEVKLNLPPDRPLKIVTISSQRELVDAADPTMEGPNAPFYMKARGRCRGMVVNGGAHAGNSYDPGTWIAANETAFKAALDAEADIVTFGEFDYPSCAFEATGPLGDGRTLQRAHDEGIKRLLLQAQRPVFAFAGSHHKWSGENCTNVGIVFRAERDETGAFEINQSFIEKRTSAKKLGEVIASTPSPQLYYFATSIARIGVLICIDAFDPGIVTSIFANSHETNIDRLQYILVPSYNPSPRLLQSCQLLSYYGNCVVVYVNAMKGAEHRSAEVFVSGVPLRTWKAQLDDFRGLVANDTKLDPRIFAAVPGLRQAGVIAQLADAAQRLDVVEERFGTFMRNVWTIPPEFVTKAAQTMAPKFPYNRARLISSLTAPAARKR